MQHSRTFDMYYRFFDAYPRTIDSPDDFFNES